MVGVYMNRFKLDFSYMGSEFSNYFKIFYFEEYFLRIYFIS